MSEPRQIELPVERLAPQEQYEFVIDAANVVETVTLTVAHLNASEPWPLMLKRDSGEYLFVNKQELKQVRLVCLECGSNVFVVEDPDKPLCADCSWEADLELLLNGEEEEDGETEE